MRRSIAAIAVLLLGCGDGAPAPSAASGTTSSASVAAATTAPSAPTSPSVLGSGLGLAPKRLTRKATPGELRVADEKACDGGDPRACRRVADRHRGYGAVAGCGVDRGRGTPFIKRTTLDTNDDERAFDRAIRRACELGDGEACGIASVAPKSYALATDVARRRAARSRPDELGIVRYRLAKTPDQTKALENLRRTCLVEGHECWTPDLLLYKRDARRGAGAPKSLPADELALVTRICDDTHDCGELMMMLDKNGYGPELLAPVRAAFASTLTDACLAGECTCGEAARYLPEDSPDRLDLGILGCENGEAEGCWEVARALSSGVGAPKDEARAGALLDLACPPTRPLELGTTDLRLGEYSPRACDRKAEIVAAGAAPPKEYALAMYYAQFACRHPGFEIDHGPCVRLGTWWAENTIATGHNAIDAREAAEGSLGGRELENECERPSVKEACDAFEKIVVTAK
jgi:TPR repeat protein